MQNLVTLIAATALVAGCSANGTDTRDPASSALQPYYQALGAIEERYGPILEGS